MLAKTEIKVRGGNAAWLHMEKNEEAYRAATGRALMCIRADARFTGLDGVRDLLAHEAAMAAIGFKEAWPKKALKLPARLGELTEEFQTMCEELLARAIEAAREREAVQ
jgi:hypothetical protein